MRESNDPRGLVFDLETVLDPGVPAPQDDRPRPDGREALPAPIHHRVVAAAAIEYRNWWPVAAHVFQGDEVAMLAGLVELIERQPGAEVATFAGASFDLPVLGARALVHGLRFPSWWSRGRPLMRRHRDLCTFFAPEVTTARFPRAEACFRALGLPGKRGGMTGGGVAAAVEQGRLDEVRRYCAEDAAQEGALYQRWAWVAGYVERTRYVESVRAWHRLLSATPDLRALAEVASVDVMLRTAAGQPAAGVHSETRMQRRST